MAVWSPTLHQLLGLLSLFLLVPYGLIYAKGIPVGVIRKQTPDDFPAFREAPAFRNGGECSPIDVDLVHIAMTLDVNYLRGTMGAVLSILQHTSCPENVEFHFLSARFEPELLMSIKSSFPYLKLKVYHFDPNRVKGKISKSIRQALDQPLNYARIYLADIIPEEVRRVIYLDSDIIVVDDIRVLWAVELGDKVAAAPEYCHANFTSYFTNAFWSDPLLAGTFENRRPCYFNTGVMILDVDKWRKGRYADKVEEWMGVQKQKTIYHLGSLPPFLLVFAGNIERGGPQVEPTWFGWGQPSLRGNVGAFTLAQSAFFIGVAKGNHG